MRRTSLRLRLLSLSLALLTVFGASLYWMDYLGEMESQALVELEHSRRLTSLSRWLELKGESLQRFASDYGQWDEMVGFVAKPTPEWAQINLAPSIDNFGVHAAWVFSPAFEPLYEVRKPFAEGFPAPPMSQSWFRDQLLNRRFLHFYALEGGVVVEYRAAPILDSSDVRRVGAPKGFFVVSRQWNTEWLQTLSAALEGEARVIPLEGDSIPAGDYSSVQSTLFDAQGRPLCVLAIKIDHTIFNQSRDYDHLQVLGFFAFGSLLISAVAFGIYAWVVRPLNLVSAALASGNQELLKDLVKEGHELGQLARLVGENARHRSTLESEIVERREAEQRLLAAETDLRKAMQSRIELGRDLHDGVIQSLYATGMALATARHHFAGNPEEASRVLEEAQQSLNAVIRDVRSFIQGLEPEPSREIPFTEGLGRMLDQLSHLAPCHFKVEVNEADFVGVDMALRAGLLQMLREAVSNALRHARATQITLRAFRYSRELQFRVEDNGLGLPEGLDPELSKGNGLRNLRQRAEDMGGSCTFECSPGSGLAVIIRLNVPSL